MPLLLRAFILWIFLMIKATNTCHSGGTVARARAAALAAPSVITELRAAKCQRADFGTYSAPELRKLASLYVFPSSVTEVSGHKGLSCNFDTEEEKCGWYNIPMTDERNGFVRARFESVFDLEKFDCTSDRGFVFEEYFLLAGGAEGLPNGPGAIEVLIPCQMDKATLSFDYWTNSDRVILKVCVIPTDTEVLSCEETTLESNPLMFEIPGSVKPFKIRIQMENIAERDVVFIDNVKYEGQTCETSSQDDIQTEDPNLSANLNNVANGISISENTIVQDEVPEFLAELTTFDASESTTATITLDGFIDDNHIGNNVVDSTIEEDLNLLSEQEISSSPTPNIAQTESRPLLDGQVIARPKKVIDGEVGIFDPCLALVCNFNSNSTCNYNPLGHHGTSAWKIGDNFLGNRHTGIRKMNPRDRGNGTKASPFLFVGLDGSDYSNEIFVLESPTFKLKESIFIVFDLYERSWGPKLKVCIDNFETCPYINPPLDADQYWRVEQRVQVDQNASKVYFVAGKVKRNLYLGLDNIRLEDLHHRNYCTSNF